MYTLFINIHASYNGIYYFYIHVILILTYVGNYVEKILQYYFLIRSQNN